MTKVLLPLTGEMIMLGQVMIHKEKLNLTSTSHYTQTLILEKKHRRIFHYIQGDKFFFNGAQNPKMTY